MVIIVDLMGGDNAPAETLKGVYMASEEFDAEYIVVGDKPQIEKIAAENGYDLSRFTVVHADSVIEMDDDPMSVVRTKKDSSMSMGLSLLAEGKGDALVSTGNTGALFTGATLITHKIKGVQRAAIATIIPAQKPLLLIDSGANVIVNAESMEQFSIMGSTYMKKVFGIENPRVGLLNNGTEACKGTPLQIECYKHLSELDEINFVGNIEGNAIPFGKCDVLVTDGFTGNILLKSIEGMGKLVFAELKKIFGAGIFTKLAYLLVKKQLKAFKKSFDSSEYGGAELLGISKPVIKAHGSSNAKAFKNAIRQAINVSSDNTIDEITENIVAYTERRRAQKKQADVRTDE